MFHPRDILNQRLFPPGNHVGAFTNKFFTPERMTIIQLLACAISITTILSVWVSIWKDHLSLDAFNTLREVSAIPPSPSGETLPKICSIVRTYGAQMNYLPLMLGALHQAGFSQNHVFLLNTDTSMSNSRMNEAVELMRFITNKKDLSFYDWTPIPQETQDYGFEMTDRMLLHLYKHANQPRANNPEDISCEYILITNGDNLYGQALGQRLAPSFKKQPDMIGFDFVSRYEWSPPYHDESNHSMRNFPGSSVLRNVEFKTLHIDLGSTIFRFEFLKQRNITFLEVEKQRLKDGTPKAGGTYEMWSDGHLIEYVRRVGNVTWLEHATVMIHQ